ncbi:MAG: EAL domain-containing protein, partial [Pseudomonadota bacterium]
FVSGLGTSETDEVIVRFTAQLAQALGLRVCAEGVETQLQLDVLKRLGCDEVQGYLFGKPVPADAFSRGLIGGGVREPVEGVSELTTPSAKREAKAVAADAQAGVVLLDGDAQDAKSQRKTRSATG